MDNFKNKNNFSQSLIKSKSSENEINGYPVENGPVFSRRQLMKSGLLLAGVAALPLGFSSINQFLKPAKNVVRIKVPALFWDQRPWLGQILFGLASQVYSSSQGEYGLEFKYAKDFKWGDFHGIISSPSLWINPVPFVFGNLYTSLTSEQKFNWLNETEIQKIWQSATREYGYHSLVLGIAGYDFGFVSSEVQPSLRNPDLLNQLSVLAYSRPETIALSRLTNLKLKKMSSVDQANHFKKLENNLNQQLISEPFTHEFWYTSKVFENPNLIYHVGSWVDPQSFDLLMRTFYWEKIGSDFQKCLKNSLAKLSQNFTANSKMQSNKIKEKISRNMKVVNIQNDEFYKAMPRAHNLIWKNLAKKDSRVSEIFNHLQEFKNKPTPLT